MHSEHRELRILLVSANPARANLIGQLMEQHGLHGELQRVPIGRVAVDRVRGRKRYRDTPRHDLVLLDFADGDERYLPAIVAIAFERRKKQPPVVLLTSTDSERLLSSGRLGESADDLFAPLGLIDFFARAREHGSRRFLDAVRVIAKLGPVLVRLPGFVAGCRDHEADGGARRAIERRVA